MELKDLKTDRSEHGNPSSRKWRQISGHQLCQRSTGNSVLGEGWVEFTINKSILSLNKKSIAFETFCHRKFADIETRIIELKRI